MDSEFTSLDAQRETCAAYIASQRHEGWETIETRYDDGGYSGGSVNRPALERLLQDAQDGLIDVIVVYKIDRLTRSLRDFSHIVDVLEKAGVSFVSVTQAFNTVSSMGRLTLNILLSFAQFERELGSERTRDKIAAAKQRGMWTGGPVPLGYDAREQKLVINKTEAKSVQKIFELFLQVPTLGELAIEVGRRGIRSKFRTSANGSAAGGNQIAKGALRHMLHNKVYRGLTVHHAQTYPGAHEAIISADLWERVQNKLVTDRVINERRGRSKSVSIFAGMIFDSSGMPMKAGQTCLKKRRYRYYIGYLAVPGSIETVRSRVPAADLETEALTALDELLGQCKLWPTFACRPTFIQRIRKLRTALRTMLPADQRAVLLETDFRVALGDNILAVSLDPGALAKRLEIVEAGNLEFGRIIHEVPSLILARTHEVCTAQLIKNAAIPKCPDPHLLKILGRIEHAYRVAKGVPDDVSGGFRLAYFQRLARLKFLAPDIVVAIFDGLQPPSLTAKRLIREELPLRWADQRALFGFA